MKCRITELTGRKLIIIYKLIPVTVNMAETTENTYIAYTYSYTYIIGGKEVKSSVDTTYTTYGIPADVKISYAGDIFVRSSVDPKSYTHGIPVDVLVSNGQTFVQDVAKHIMASAPLIEIDKNGNINQVPDAKAKVIAGRCVKYANMLQEAIEADGNSDDSIIRENEALKEKISALEPKYEKERIENAINKQYIINLEKVLETNHIEKPSKPTSIKDITDNTIKDSISDIIEGDKPGDDNPGSPDAPNNTYPIPQP